tara:strand:+ start:6773 stop:10474 length:3702 start_codon:yes stop_codon:yes gene_type:complete
MLKSDKQLGILMRTVGASKAYALVILFLVSLMTPIISNSSSEGVDEITILHTAINPENNNTYHLLSAATWEDSATVARGLDGFLTTIDSIEENTWVFDTFANFDNQSRHLWTGLSDHDEEGYYKWHDGTPFYYRNWGEDQPSSNDEEDFVHIAGTNIGNIMPGTWNDLSNDPELVPVYGVVEIGPGADYALRFDGDDDHIIIEEELPNWENHIEIEAMINMPDISGIQFITMIGDYGWGLYINNGQLAYSSEYSMSKNPVSNISISEDTWTHVKVVIEEDYYGEFFIDDIPAGLIDANDSKIPEGDFGSNNCFQNGLECDELIIGKMGAGCDCNYFMGMIDDLKISNAANESFWQFTEGEGMYTDDLLGITGEIYGASWVMPDGSIVAQAIQIFNGEEIFDITGMPGDQLLFFAEIEEMTKGVYFSAFEEFKEWFEEDETNFEIYVAYEYIPNSWEHDFVIETEWGFAFEEWQWPEAGTWWFVIVPVSEIESLSIYLEWDVADPPPPLEDMTELYNGIPVTGQSISGGRNVPLEDKLLYYYVDLTENLSSLSIKTYGGTGNIDLGISWNTVPDPFDFGFFPGLFEDDFSDADSYENQKVAWDGGPGNDNVVTLYDLEPGIYYITAYTYQRASDFTISAQFTYEPNNVEPEDAIELFPGQKYGPLTGYESLDQYFKINVPTGTERLEVDLSGGFGEATLFMKYEQAPTTAEFDYLSSSPGAGDIIGFNDPTPGMWYILLDTEEVFGEVMITASFKDRYVWSYDGTPIELFNKEEILGIQAPEGEQLFFFVNLEKAGEYLQISTYGGSGDLTLELEGNVIVFDFEDFIIEFDEEDLGRQRPSVGTDYEEVEIESYGEGTSQTIFVDLPANGRFDITLTAETDLSDVSIIANWVYSDFIDSIDVDEPVLEPVVEMSCRDNANEIMKNADKDSNGIIDEAEFKMFLDTMDVAEEDFKSVDLDSDGEIEFAEVLQESCRCDNEIWVVFDQLSGGQDSVSIELLSSQKYENKYNFIGMDTNSDSEISETEIELMTIICVTTFDAFDGDGDGVPDDEDDFPNDPDETKDTDGDGVGDNADIAPSIANDLVYSIGAIVFVGLLALLVLVTRGNRNNMKNEDWGDEKKFDIAETMLGMQEEPREIPVQEMITSQAPTVETPQTEFSSNNLEFSNNLVNSSPGIGNDNLPSFEDLLDSGEQTTAPPSQLMGMIGFDGKEIIEYPFNSGVKWTRNNPGEEWSKY